MKTDHVFFNQRSRSINVKRILESSKLANRAKQADLGGIGFRIA